MKTNAFKAAFPYTIPIAAGFFVLGISYGFMMTSRGFSCLFPIFMAMFIFAGSMEFVAANLLLASFDPAGTFFLTLMVNARHLFYGLSMLEKYKGTGWKKSYLIFALCDETFSINCSVEPPADVDRGWFMFFVSLLNQCWWVGSAAVGALLGQWIPLDATGVEFSMTALFVVMFLDQWEKAREHRPALIGLGCSVACVLAFQANFIIPAMVLIIASFVPGYLKWKESRHDVQ